MLFYDLLLIYCWKKDNTHFDALRQALSTAITSPDSLPSSNNSIEEKKVSLSTTERTSTTLQTNSTRNMSVSFSDTPHET